MPVSQTFTRVGLLTPQKGRNDRVDLKLTVNARTASNQVNAIPKPLTFDSKQTLEKIEDMFQERNGARKDIPNILIAFTNDPLLQGFVREQAALTKLITSGVKLALIDDGTSGGFDRFPDAIQKSLAVIKIESGQAFNTEAILEELVKKLKRGK